MNKIYKIAIIGGGASGVACAVELFSGEDSISCQDLVLLEGNDRLLKKLSASGNGQGNITNAYISESNYSGDKKFVSAFIENLKKVSLTDFFKNLNIRTVTAENGRVYPMSMQANAVTDILRFFLASKNVEVKLNTRISEVYEKNGVFVVKAESGETFFAENVVISCGGKAGKQFGTDGAGYKFCRSFGHAVTPLLPSLVQLKAEKSAIKGLNGVKERAKLSLYDGDRFIKSATGDLLFTEYGVSGNAVFQVSDKAVCADKPHITAEFLPDVEKEYIAHEIKARKNAGHFTDGELLTGLINKKLGQAIIKSSGNSPEKIAEKVKNFVIPITGNLGFDYAQVTKGGVNTDEIDALSYESKLKKGLYVTGETLDIDGECGGYNLTFAFLSGIIAAKNLKSKIKRQQ